MATRRTPTGPGSLRQLQQRRRADARTRPAVPRDISQRRTATTTRTPGCPSVQPPATATNPTITQRQQNYIIALNEAAEQELPQLVIQHALFTIYSDEEIRKDTNIEVTVPEAEGLNSVNDPRMGTVSDVQLCHYCRNTHTQCIGHFGYIPLAEPIYHPLFIKHVIMVLQCVCKSCGGLLVPVEQMERLGITNYTGITRLTLLAAEATKGYPCMKRHNVPGGPVQRCAMNPEYLSMISEQTHQIMFKYPDSETSMLPIDQVEAILDAITDEEARLMGFENGAHPRRFIKRTMPVTPPCNRTPFVQDGTIHLDDLTTMYIDIVKTNEQLRATPRTDESRRKELSDKLFHAISHLIDNTDKSYSQGGRKQFLSLKERLQGKQGVIRQTLQGKRVNFAGRTVITPEPNLKYGQAAIPKIMAPLLTKPVRVAAFNQRALQKLLEEGKIQWITPASGDYKGRRIKAERRYIEGYQLEIGDVVDRWLQNGDVVIINRQPTLHRGSMIGVEVVLRDTLSMGLHLSTTMMLNADFDGDEMNIHVPQSPMAEAEVRTIMNTKECLMTPQANKPMTGLTFDDLSSVYLLTQPETMVPMGVFFSALTLLSNPIDIPSLDARLARHSMSLYEEDRRERKEAVSGRALFSALLPADFYYQKGGVFIADGVLIKGVVDNKHVGTAHGSIVQALYIDYGPMRTVDFLTDASWVLSRFMQHRGLSIGIRDCSPEDPELRELVNQEITKAVLQVEAQGTRLENAPDRARVEQEIMGYLRSTRDTIARLVQERLGPTNAFRVMSQSGAKGKDFNTGQIIGMIGPQTIKGQLAPFTIMEGTRCLPYFKRGETDPIARGLCKNSFVSGVSPAELFYQQWAGGEGLTDTALKTAETGTAYRDMSEALKNLTVQVDHSVRDRVGNVIQFVYGEDAFDAAQLEKVRTQTGDMISFANLKRVAGRLNSRYGYVQYQDLGEVREGQASLERDIELPEDFGEISTYDDGD